MHQEVTAVMWPFICHLGGRNSTLDSKELNIENKNENKRKHREKNNKQKNPNPSVELKKPGGSKAKHPQVFKN